MMKNARLKIAACSALALVVASSTGLTSFDLLALDQAQAMAKKPRPRAPSPPPGGYLHPLIVELRGQTVNRSTSKKEEYWAHRGLFHATTIDSFPNTALTVLPENSVQSVRRAYQHRLGAVEIDVRLSLDNVPMIAHDFVTARYTGLDGFNGKYNPQWAVEMKQQLAGNSTISGYKSDDLKKYYTKSYGPGSKMRLTTDNVRTLAQLLSEVGNDAPLIVLDLQDSATVAAAAAVVRNANMQNRVVLKFFAAGAVPAMTINNGDVSSAVSQQIKAWGDDLWYVIQFNDSQLTGTNSTSPGSIMNSGLYIDPIVWAEYFLTTGRLIGIGISRPSTGDDKKLTALERLKQNYSKTGNMIPRIGIMINPDSSWVVPNQSCTLYRFNANADTNKKVSTTTFSFDADGEQARRDFAKDSNYIIADLLPKHTLESDRSTVILGFTASSKDFNRNFCNASLDSSIIANPG